MSIEAMKLALDALEYEAKRSGDGAYLFEREALRQAIEQAENSVVYDKTEMNCFVQELYDKKMQEGKHGHYETMFHCVHQAIKKLYTTPQPQREWVGLTDEEIEEGIKQSWVTEQAFQSAAWWAEAKLRSKNNG
jgi:hypothetical protein